MTTVGHEPPSSTAAVVPRFLAVSAQWAWRGLVVALAVYVAVRAAVVLRFVVVPIFLALVIAALLVPLVDIASRAMPRLVATWLVILTTIGAIAGLIVVAANTVISAARDLIDRSDEALEQIRSWLVTGPLGLSDRQVDELYDRIGEATRSATTGFTESPTSAALLALEIFGALLLSLVLTFFFIKDGPTMWGWALKRVRPIRRDPLDAAGRAAISNLQGWVRGAAITGVVDGAIIGVALWILGVPAVLPLALFTFFGAFFPIVGATIAGALAAAVALADSGPRTALIVALVVLVVQQIEGDVLLPLVMYQQVALHPVIVILALAVGAAIGGVVGALVSVPITAAGVGAIAAVRALDDGQGDPSDDTEPSAHVDG